MVKIKIFLIFALVAISALFLVSCQSADELGDVVDSEEIVDVGDESAALSGRASYGLPDCTDSDAGLDYPNLGTASYSWGPSREDVCWPTTSQPERLAEYYCYTKPQGDYIARRVYNCASSGDTCVDGACVSSSVVVPVCNDDDGDGYGDPADASCTSPELDCNPKDPNINPGATEICGDGIDQDCSGADEVCVVNQINLSCGQPINVGDTFILNQSEFLYQSSDRVTVQYPNSYFYNNNLGVIQRSINWLNSPNSINLNYGGYTYVFENLSSTLMSNFTIELVCPPLSEVGLCSDSIDNDIDGDIDCADSDCSADTFCLQPEVGASLCGDGLDNDEDGLIDCVDSGCNFYTGPDGFVCNNPEVYCSDGSDNDYDGLIDCADSDCTIACTQTNSTNTTNSS